MLEGKCPKCGRHFIGWALANPRHQTCDKCGVGLEIFEGGRRIDKGYSPFAAEKYLIDQSHDLSAPKDKENKGKARKDKN